MNSDQMEGKWKQFKGGLKQKWGKLTDDDLDVIAGSQEKLAGKLQERYGYAKEEAKKQADEWFNTIDEPSFAEHQQAHHEAMRESPETVSRR